MNLEPPPNPLIAILGTTGTGKSKLAVELARRFDGEIINGDAMQMYKGLPVITNKISEAERQGVPHWILDQIGLEEQPWTVQRFRSEARQKIQEIRSRGRLPILVGGTHYYAEAVLFNDRASLGGAGDDGLSEDEKEKRIQDVRQAWPILEAPTSEVLARLREVDPQMANRWHPRDRRKIQRSLEIWLQTGKTASQTYEEQRQRRLRSRKATTNNGNNAGDESTSAYYPSLIFLLRADRDSLKRRLDDRVDSMLASGLIQEAQEMAAQGSDLTRSGVTVDKTKGIWTSIGYKEMTPYLDAISDPTKPPTETEQIRTSCIESIKSATRHYARRQDRWIRNHLATTLTEADSMDDDDDNNNTIYPLDCTKVGQEEWTTNVYTPATDTVSAFLTGKKLRRDPASLSDMVRTTIAEMRAGSQNKNNGNDIDIDIDIDIDNNPDAQTDDKDTATNETIKTRECRPCQICDKIMMTDKEWTAHLASRSHRKAVTGKRKWEAFKAWQATKATTMTAAMMTPEAERNRMQNKG